MTEVDGEVQITWGLQQLDLTHLQLTPSYTQVYTYTLTHTQLHTHILSEYVFA